MAEPARCPNPACAGRRPRQQRGSVLLTSAERRTAGRLNGALLWTWLLGLALLLAGLVLSLRSEPFRLHGLLVLPGLLLPASALLWTVAAYTRFRHLPQATLLRCPRCRYEWSIVAPPFDHYQSTLAALPEGLDPTLSARLQGRLHVEQAVRYILRGNLARARILLTSARALGQATRDTHSLLAGRYWEAELARARGDLTSARRQLEETSAESRAQGSWLVLAATLTTLGYLYVVGGRREEARACLAESLALRAHLRARACTADTLITVALLAASRHAWEEARALLDAAEGLVDEGWWPLAPWAAQEQLLLHAVLPPAPPGAPLAFDALLALGQQALAVHETDGAA